MIAARQAFVNELRSWEPSSWQVARLNLWQRMSGLKREEIEALLIDGAPINDQGELDYQMREMVHSEEAAARRLMAAGIALPGTCTMFDLWLAWLPIERARSHDITLRAFGVSCEELKAAISVAKRPGRARLGACFEWFCEDDPSPRLMALAYSNAIGPVGVFAEIRRLRGVVVSDAEIMTQAILVASAMGNVRRENDWHAHRGAAGAGTKMQGRLTERVRRLAKRAYRAVESSRRDEFERLFDEIDDLIGDWLIHAPDFREWSAEWDDTAGRFITDPALALKAVDWTLRENRISGRLESPFRAAVPVLRAAFEVVTMRPATFTNSSKQVHRFGRMSGEFVDFVFALCGRYGLPKPTARVLRAPVDLT